MSDPRYTDPRYSNPWNCNAMLGDGPVGGTTAGIFGLCIMVLIAAMIIIGIYVKHNHDSISNNLAPITNHGMPMTSPSVTGSGSTSPQPLTPPPHR